MKYKKELTLCSPEQFIKLMDTIRKIQAEQDFHEQLKLVAESIVEIKLFERAIISLFSPTMERIDVAWAGLTKSEVQELQKIKPPSPELWKQIFSPQYKISHSYYIPHNTPLNKKIRGIKSRAKPKEFKGGWHPNDYLFVPLYGRSSKQPLGVISVDDPCDKTRPIRELLPFLELFAQETAVIIEKSLLYKRIAEMEHYFKEIAESSADIIVTTDAEGKVRFFNRGASEILGYKPEEIIGKPVVTLYENIEKAKYTMRVVRESGGRIRNFETEARAKDGTLIPISLSVAILYDENHRFVGTAGIAKDLRELKELQEKAYRDKLSAVLLRHINNYLMGINAIEWKLKEVLTQNLPPAGLKRKVISLFERVKKNVNKISVITTKILESDSKELEKLDIRKIKIPREKIKLHPHAPYKGMKVLVADDEPDIREGFESFLKYLGFEVFTAKDGQEAIDILNSQKKIDLIITDIKMPKKSGDELIKEALKENPHQPIIIATAFMYDSTHTAIKTGVTNIFSKEKPFNLVHLEDLIDKALSRTK